MARSRYNGYRFGDQTIYNPWSVLCYLSNRGDGIKAYWVHTSSDDILRELLVDGGRVDGGDLETLLGGGCIDKPVDEHLVLRDVRSSSASIWSFLLFSGYLRADGRVGDDAAGRPVYPLRLPNYEVRLAYTSLFAGFLDRGLGGDERTTQLCWALLAGDATSFGRNAYVRIHHIVRNPTIQPRDICRHAIGGTLRVLSVNRSAVRPITGCGR